MTTKAELIRSLETIAGRRPGSYNDETPLSLVCSPTGIVPKVLFVFLSEKFGDVVRQVGYEDFTDGDMTLGALHDRLTRDQSAPAG
jgi:hypothetical protein